MNRRTEKIFTALFGLPLFLLSLIFPKQRNLWLFGAWFGQKYADNSKVLFEHVCRYRSSEIEARWITKVSAEELPDRHVYAFSLHGIWLQFRARVFVCCVNSFDFLAPLVTPRSLRVQLYHGTPLKQVGNLVEEPSSLRRFIRAIRSRSTDRYDLVVSPGPYTDRIFCEAFGVDKTVLFRAQYPRCEELLVSAPRRKEIRESLGISSNDIFYLYLPTHRNEGIDAWKNIEAFEELRDRSHRLHQANVKIIMKPHFYEAAAFEGVESSEQVCLHRTLPADLYSVLGATDGLITDYSSVIFDYSVLDRPIILFAYDLEDYLENDRELLVDIRSISENIASSVDDVIRMITETDYGRGESSIDFSFVEPNLPNPCEAITNEIERRLGGRLAE